METTLHTDSVRMVGGVYSPKHTGGRTAHVLERNIKSPWLTRFLVVMLISQGVFALSSGWLIASKHDNPIQPEMAFKVGIGGKFVAN